MIRRFGAVLTLVLVAYSAMAQNATVRGLVFDEGTGDPIPFASVVVSGTTNGAITDIDGFYSIVVAPGTVDVMATTLGYDSMTVSIELKAGQIKKQNFTLTESSTLLNEVNISARKDQAKTETRVSVVQVSPMEIEALPSIGGDADIAQYLTVLPGIISSGDQGGQLYIRGGSPVQNRVVLDGITIYRPFHSIGLNSVFENEIVRNIDVHSGGFNAEHGGRISAIVDIDTREGDKKRISGLVGASPFQARAIVEGPLRKFDTSNTGTASFILAAKHSYLDETSTSLYDWALDDEDGLPYTYTDLYGKLSLVSENGSSFNFSGFNFTDRVNLSGVTDVDWDAFGGSMEFNLIPPNSNLIFGGNVSYSDYGISLVDAQDRPRTNDLTDLNIRIHFTYFGYNNELRYGIDVNAISTDFSFVNFLDLNFDQKVNNTDIAGYVKYKQILGRLIVEPGLRLQYYAGQSEFSFEPRISAKFNITDRIRIKGAAGLYSQNLVSTVSDRDIVNLFFGYLSAPEGILRKPGSSDLADHPLQKATHLVGGLEVDVTEELTLNVEPYLKQFDQLIALNRNKLSAGDPNFVTETGEARGIDFSASYEKGPIDLWATYSLGYVDRDNGTQEYWANFDRRHNVNLLATYAFGNNRSWQASVRWNYGSGFPFTELIGFYGNQQFFNTTDFDFITSNPDLTPVFDDDINEGRLPEFHRLDASISKRLQVGQHGQLKVTASITNAYDRQNIFYIDLLTLQRVDQLPLLPSLGVEYKF